MNANRCSLSKPSAGHAEDGVIAVTTVVMLVLLMLIGGLATDLGYWYVRSGEIERAADASALAAVVWMPDLSKATNVARQVAAQNGSRRSWARARSA